MGPTCLTGGDITVVERMSIMVPACLRDNITYGDVLGVMDPTCLIRNITYVEVLGVMCLTCLTCDRCVFRGGGGWVVFDVF